MTVRGIPAPQLYRPDAYWEDRARRFAGDGEGLAAVCAYGMPEFYNRAIHLEQRLALEPWLNVAAGTRVLDVGCGVGRWSRLLAARGAEVLGVDLSPTMIAQARRRAAADGVAGTAVEHRSIDGRGSRGDFTCMKDWFQAVFAVALPHNGDAASE